MSAFNRVMDIALSVHRLVLLKCVILLITHSKLSVLLVISTDSHSSAKVTDIIFGLFSNESVTELVSSVEEEDEVIVSSSSIISVERVSLLFSIMTLVSSVCESVFELVSVELIISSSIVEVVSFIMSSSNIDSLLAIVAAG